MDQEIWKPLFDQEWYEVSNYGRVISWIDHPSTSERALIPRLLKPALNKRGYLMVVAGPRGKRRTYGVHQLVLLGFVGPLPEGMQTRHLDGNKLNNHWPSNLVYGTPEEQGADNRRLGVNRRGMDQNLAKLTDDQVLEIRARYAKGDTSYRKLAAEYGVNASTVERVVNGSTWKHLLGRAA